MLLSLLESSLCLLPGVLMLSVVIPCNGNVTSCALSANLNIFGIEAAMIMIDDSARPQMSTSAIRQVWSAHPPRSSGIYDVLIAQATPALCDDQL